MLEFPKLKTQVSVQYPLRRIRECALSISRFLDGGEQRFAGRKSRMRWQLRFTDLDEGEAQALVTFAAQHLETLEKFSFTDPVTGVEYVSCVLEKTNLTIENLGDGRVAAQLGITEEGD